MVGVGPSISLSFTTITIVSFRTWLFIITNEINIIHYLAFHVIKWWPDSVPLESWRCKRAIATYLGCFASAMQNGFRIYNTEPLSEKLSKGKLKEWSVYMRYKLSIPQRTSCSQNRTGAIRCGIKLHMLHFIIYTYKGMAGIWQ